MYSRKKELSNKLFLKFALTVHQLSLGTQDLYQIRQIPDGCHQYWLNTSKCLVLVLLFIYLAQTQNQEPEC